jgi:hypothetical protein
VNIDELDIQDLYIIAKVCGIETVEGILQEDLIEQIEDVIGGVLDLTITQLHEPLMRAVLFDIIDEKELLYLIKLVGIEDYQYNNSQFLEMIFTISKKEALLLLRENNFSFFSFCAFHIEPLIDLGKAVLSGLNSTDKDFKDSANRIFLSYIEELIKDVKKPTFEGPVLYYFLKSFIKENKTIYIVEHFKDLSDADIQIIANGIFDQFPNLSLDVKEIYTVSDIINNLDEVFISF